MGTVVSRILMALFVFTVCGLFGAPIWAAILGAMIVSYQAFPERSEP